MRISKILFFVFCLIFMSSCSNPCNEFSRETLIALNTDNKITKTEWNRLIKFINTNKKDLSRCHSNLFESKELVEDSLCNQIFTIAKTRIGVKEKPTIDYCIKTENKIKPPIKVFLENSGSMHGYVRGNTRFEAAIGNLLVKIKHKYDKENIHLNFVNTEIIPIDTEIIQFIEDLDPATIKKGKTSSSNLNGIFKLILDETENGIGNDDIGILISDCMYSMEGTDTEGLLAHQKNLTMDAFLEKFKKMKANNNQLATIIIKMISNFEGRYYFESTNRTMPNTWLNVQERPYYIWIIGRSELLNGFYSNIPLNRLEGYEHIYMLLNNKSIKDPDKIFLTSTKKIGTFRKDRDNDFALIEIEPEAMVFQFSIGLNIESDVYRINTEYLTNEENYSVQATDIFDISVDSRDSVIINPRENPNNKPFTHVITFKTNELRSQQQTLTFQLNKKIPTWVTDSHTIDDTNIETNLNKTFGFSYLIEGVTEAYRTGFPGNDYYFKISIPLKK